MFILLGARQTGKTFTVRQFARANYADFLEINFLEDQENGAFLAHASSAGELASRLSLIAGHELGPDTLVFLDEVQELGHEVVTLSKFLVEDGRFSLVLSGSLLGTRLKGVRSFPVGYARVERMYPLDFEEYCWAMGVPETLLEEIRRHWADKEPLEETIHARMIRLYRQHIVMGGMPEAVQSFLNASRELGAARSVDGDIAEQYRYDIVKDARSREAPIIAVFDNIPAQLAKENKRFMLSSVQTAARYERLKDDFDWLIEAGVALACRLVKEPKYPLMRTLVPERFKLYSSDTSARNGGLRGTLRDCPLRGKRVAGRALGKADIPSSPLYGLLPERCGMRGRRRGLHHAGRHSVRRCWAVGCLMPDACRRHPYASAAHTASSSAMAAVCTLRLVTEPS